MQVMKMSNAMSKGGYLVTLYGRKPNEKPQVNVTFKEIYGLTQKFRTKTYKGSQFLKYIDYDLKILKDVLVHAPNLIYTRNVRSALLGCFFNVSTILELHHLPCTRLNRFMLWYISKNKNLIKIIVISNNLKTILSSKYPFLNKKHIIVCHDAIDIDRFSNVQKPSNNFKENLGLVNENKTVGYVGHLYNGRGIELIQELAQKLRKINFLIIGGTESDVAFRKSIAQSLNIQNLFYIGFVPNAKLPKYYQVSDALLMPYQDSVQVSGGGNTADWMSPMKAYEYMAAAKPIICSDLPALREIFSEENCLFAPHDDTELWKSHIENALTNSALAHRISSKAQDEAKLNTWDSRVTKILT